MEEALEGFRLSPQQRRLWALRRDAGIPVAWIEATLAGDLDADALRAALGRVVERHEALRTTFPVLSGMSVPLQVVAAPDFTWEDEDGVSQDFNLGHGPLLRARLTEVAPREHRLRLSVPALCCDGLSLFHVLEDVAREYSGQADDGAEPPMQAIDFSEWQNELLESDEGGELWRRQSAQGLDGWRLPAEAAAGSGDSASVEIPLDGESAARLAAETGVPLAAVFLAAWQTLLGRLNGQGRLVVGAAFDGRPYEELSRSVGFLARYLPLGCDLGEAGSFRDLLARTGAAWNEAAKWQESFSWERFAQSEGGVPAESPFRAGFRFDDQPAISDCDGLRISVAGWQADFEPVPLELRLRRTDSALAASLVHDPALLPAAEARRLADQYPTLLASALAAPDAPLDDLELLPEDERRALLVDFNAASTAEESGLLHHRFAAQAARTPDAPAAVAAGRSMTFAELDAEANRLARCLRRRGVGPGSLVAVALDRSPDLLAALLAVLKAGGAYLPLDAAQPRERLARILEAARPQALVTSPRYPGSLPEGREAAVLDLEADRAEWTAESTEDPQVPVQAEDLAYVLFTSGSTGTPKGVMIPHAGLANYLAWAGGAYPVAEGRGAPVHSPIGFDLTVTSLFLPLLAGRPAVLLPEEPGLGALAGALTEGDFGLAKLTPAHLEALAELVPREALARSARSLVLGGEALTGERLRPWRAANPGLRVFNEYGPTEAVVGCCVYEMPLGDPAPGAVPIGRPIANTRLYVLNRRLRPVPAGVPGELYIGGAGVARGYLGQPALTAERFVPDPFSESTGQAGERLYKTGDRVRHGADGQLEFLGRVDHQVKIRGHRVEPGEIEAVLEQHPAVRECAVVARQDGDAAGRRLVAYVVAEEGQETRAGELRAFLEARLPAYMVPAAFVPLPALPLTANGKVDRAALPAPGRGRPELEETFVRPQGLEEEVLAEIWAAVLGLENVGSNDNFFALGGDSIRSIQVRSEAEKRNLHFTVQQIFQYPTVRTLARALRGEHAAKPELAEDAPIAPFALITEEDRRRLPADVEDAYPVAQLQAGMLFHSELLPGSAIYHDIYTFRLRGPLDLLTLRAALQRLAARHEALRTSFDLSGASEPLQRVHRHVEVPVEYEDLSGLPAAEQDGRVAAWQADEKLRPFDWSRPPLLRAHVHRLGADAFQFSFGFHHAILDGWSVATMLSELFRVYLALVAGEAAPPEPPLAIGYRNFVAAEQRALRSPDTRSYWEERVGDALRTTLPRRPTVRDSYDERDIQGHTVPFTPQLSEDLKRIARQAGVPLKSVLLAAHFRVLSVLTGQTDVATGLVSNGRIEAEGGERMLGLFLNTLPLRQRLPGGPWLDLVRDAFEVERGAFPHRRFPLAELQRMSGGEPIFETVFNFMHFHVYESVGGLRGLEVTGGDAFEEANFPFAANFSVGGPASLLVLRFDYDARQFDADQIAFFGRVYDRTLHALAADPRARYDHPAPLAEEEKLQLLRSGEGEAAAAPAWTVPERLAAIARETPDALAAVFEEELGRVSELRYGDLDARANQLARHLVRLGAGRGDLVGLCLRRSPELLAGIFGILKAGAAYLPLDPAYPRERLAQILADARVSLVVTDEPAATRLPDGSARLVLLDRDREEIGRESAEPFQLSVTGDDAAYVVYTSGSTGVPKGVVATHGGLANFSQAVTAAVGLAPGRRMLQFASIAFDASGLQIFPTLTSGATLVLHPDPAGLTSQEIRELCVRLGVTVLDLPGALWRQWVETLAQENLPVPESVEVYMTGGERLTGETLRLWARILPGDGLFLSSYGPTEATITTLFFSARASRVSFDPRYEPPLGRPLPGTRIRLLDAACEPVPECVPGELYIGGAGLARGYLHRPDLTAERFLPDAFAGMGGEPGARLYRTGDLARPLPDGGFEFQGRTDHQVKIRGFRVEPGEIEAVLARHPAVREAVVLPREDRPGQKRLVAYLLIDPQAGAAPEVADLRAHVGRFLPDYMVPSAFLALDELPLLPSGKVDRRALPAVDAVGLALGSGYVAPRTPVEEIVAGIWAKVIGAERVGAHDNFFELGGHSLLATQVITRLRQTLEIDLPLRALFEAPTVEGLTAVILADPEQRAKVERTAELTVQLAGLSEDEVERMLLAESGLESNLT